jgi:hypothetical protein
MTDWWSILRSWSSTGRNTRRGIVSRQVKYLPGWNRCIWTRNTRGRGHQGSEEYEKRKGPWRWPDYSYMNIKLITKLFNRIYNLGDITEDWLKWTFITLPKKTITKTGNNYRLISEWNFPYKSYTQDFTLSAKKLVETHNTASKMGLDAKRPFLDWKCVCEKAETWFICFVHYRKALGTIKHALFMKLLKKVDIDGKDLRI